MKLSIKENDKPDLEICEMTCDNGLSDKLNKYELTKLLNTHTTNLFIGRPKSGKTSLLFSFFKSPLLLKKVYTKIWVFQPTNSGNSMKDNIFSKLPDTQRFNELTLDNLTYVMNQIKSEDKSVNSCILFDDMSAYLKDKETLKLLKELMMNKRHLHVSIFFMVQTWKSVEKDIRRLFNNVFLFKISKNEMESVGEEIIERDKKILPLLSALVFDEPYKYLVINVDSGRFFSGFDEIIVS